MTAGPPDEQPRPTEPAQPVTPAENTAQPPTTPAPPPVEPVTSPPAPAAAAPAEPPAPVRPRVVETSTTARVGPAPIGDTPPTPRSVLEKTLPLDPLFSPFSLTVGDGFKFGCGFLMALTIASLIGFLVLSLILLVASLVGAPLPIGR